MNILFLHGMGGGMNSPVPRKLKQVLPQMQFTKDGNPCSLQVICETYDFDPEVASGQIAQWVEAYHPDLVISESMGGIHALGIRGIPHIYISPALNYDRGAEFFKPIVALGELMGYHYTSQRSAKRQLIQGDPKLLAKFRPMIKKYKEAILNSERRDPSFAFFGKKDEYMIPGIVSIKEYERLFGASYEEHDGGHVFGVKNVKPKLIPKIVEMLGLEVVKKPRERKKIQDTNTITMYNESNNLQQENLKNLSWDTEQAKQRLAIRDRFTAGIIRTEVYKHNLKIFEAWKYVAPSGKVIELPGTRQELLDATRVYREVVSAAEVPVRYQTTRTGCVNADCMVVAKNLIDQGLNPAILNMANPYKACGNYNSGDGSQEPSLCRASTLAPTLYQYYNKMWAKKAGVTLREPSGYPIDVRFGGIYTPNVTVFRDDAFTGFALREEPFQTSIITMGALNFNPNPKIAPSNNLEYRAQDGGFTPEGEEVMCDKIRTLYRIALLNGHDSLVLGAFGCKTFRLKPEHVSALFKKTLEETEFKGKFHTIVFALLEGFGGPRKQVEEKGKLASFYEQFGRLR